MLVALPPLPARFTPALHWQSWHGGARRLPQSHTQLLPSGGPDTASGNYLLCLSINYTNSVWQIHPSIHLPCPFHQHGLFPSLAQSEENTSSADLVTGGCLLPSHYTPYSSSCWCQTDISVTICQFREFWHQPISYRIKSLSFIVQISRFQNF